MSAKLFNHIPVVASMLRPIMLLSVLLMATNGYAESDLPVRTQGPQSAQELSIYLDDTLSAEALEAQHIPGMAVWFGQGDFQVAKGYGVANTESGDAVSAQTPFRIASVSKIFVAIAAMQLVEQGRLDLGRDINHYLTEFKIDDRFAQPISMRHLLTHTAGLEERMWGDLSLRRENWQSLGPHLAMALPRRVHPPGTVVSYSNYGVALAGFVIEQISGQRFADYVQKHILLPTGMHHSGYDLSADLQAQLATGYRYRGGHYQEQPYTWVHRYPSTSMISTAEDMGRLISMLLNDGRAGDTQVLRAESVRTLMQQHYTQDPQLPGMTLGFMQWRYNGQQMIWHDGEHVGFSAQLVIIPEHKAGYFIVSNAQDSELSSALRYGYIEQFFHVDAEPVLRERTSLEDLSAYAGNYLNNRLNRSSVEKLSALFELGETVKVDADGYLIWWNKRFIPLGEHRFQQQDGSRILAFETDAHGNVAGMSIDWGGAPRVLERRSGLRHPLVQLGMLLAMFLSAVLVASHGLYGWKRSTRTGLVQARTLLLSVTIGNLLLLAFVIGLITLFANIDPLSIRAAHAPGLLALLALPMLMLAALALGLWQWQRGRSRVSYLSMLGALNLMAFAAWLQHWNLLGYQLC